MGAVLAIDFGTKRLGVAVSDRERSFVFARETITRTTPERDLAALAEVARDDGVDLVVVGLPLNADGSEGPMAKAAREFAARLTAVLGLGTTFADERYTSIEADEKLRERFPRDTRKRKALRDRVAATLILRTWLEHGSYRESR